MTEHTQDQNQHQEHDDIASQAIASVWMAVTE